MLFIRTAGIMNSQIAGLDADAQTFLTATAITDSTISSAINSLVVAAKANGWWTLCSIIYPFVGGTATTHGYNLKNTVVFRMTNATFTSGITHDANGITGNGTTGYGDTGLNVNTLSNTDTHCSMYNRTNNGSFGYDVGAIDNTVSPNLGMIISLNENSATPSDTEYFVTSRGASIVINTVVDTRGYHLVSRRSVTDVAAYKNGSSIGSAALDITGSSMPSLNFFISGRNTNGAATSFTNRNLAFITVGSGITPALTALMYTDIQNFQTTLGRQV